MKMKKKILVKLSLCTAAILFAAVLTAWTFYRMVTSDVNVNLGVVLIVLLTIFFAWLCSNLKDSIQKLKLLNALEKMGWAPSDDEPILDTNE